MTEVKRYGNFDAAVDANGKVLKLIIHESIDGQYVLFSDHKAAIEEEIAAPSNLRTQESSQ